MLSKSSVYGIRASLYLAAHNRGQYNSIREVSEELDISFHFLTKILQNLTADNLMESYKGPNGGIRLSAKGRKATLLDVVIAIDGPDLFVECALGLPGCGSSDPCPLHNNWAMVREGIKDMLARTTLEEMAKEGKANKFRITPDGHFSWQ
ncbi:MAG: Rrf2 family transcriptional regulator [Balneolaceae bacterium]|nr:Rrf2 family transcriptional regulator [Balneolaceae bacterium]